MSLAIGHLRVKNTAHGQYYTYLMNFGWHEVSLLYHSLYHNQLPSRYVVIAGVFLDFPSQRSTECRLGRFIVCSRQYFLRFLATGKKKSSITVVLPHLVIDSDLTDIYLHESLQDYSFKGRLSSIWTWHFHLQTEKLKVKKLSLSWGLIFISPEVFFLPPFEMFPPQKCFNIALQCAMISQRAVIVSAATLFCHQR